MSLVSTVNDQERNEILLAGAKTGSSIRDRKGGVYQTSGEPLSKEALYRAKLKYGVYESPATKTSTGVVEPRMASDIAANLANDNKVVITAYKRLYVDPGAASAATKVGVRGLEPVKKIEVAKIHEGSQSAATRAYSLVSNDSRTKKVTKSGSSTASRSRAHSLSSATHAYNANAQAVSAQQEKVNPKPKPLNMSKVLSGAERQAEKRIHDRTTPSRENFSYGLRTDAPNKAAGNSVLLTKEALQRMSSRIESSVIEREADPYRLAENAAFAVRNIDPKTLMDPEYQENEKKREEYLKLLTSQQVLARARENAEKELKLIEAMDHNKLLFGNEKFNEAALEHVKKNNEKKLPYQNKINMGGGLWLAPDEIDNIAKNMVSPLLGEVSERADNQRATDLDIKERTDAYKQGYAEWISLQTTKLRNNETYVASSESRIAKEKQGAQDKATKRFASLIRKNDEKLAEINKELEETTQLQSNLETELQQLLKSKAKENEAMIANFDQSIDKDLEEARKEQEELLKPYHDAVQEAEEEHERLIAEKETINIEISKLHKSIDNHNVMLLKYQRGIVSYDEQQEQEIGNLETLGQTKDELHEDLNLNVIKQAREVKEQAAISTEEARLKQLEVEMIVNERKSQLNATEIELKKEQLKMLEVMKDAAEARGDEKLDEERIKVLIGMPYDEFIKQHKDLQTSVAEELKNPPVSEDLDEEDEVDEDLGKNVKENDQSIVDSNQSVVAASGVIDGTTPTHAVQSKPGEAENTKTEVKTTEAKADEPTWSEKFFIGSENAKRKKVLDKQTAPAGSALTKSSPTKDDPVKNNLAPTFSGFSQGSIADDVPNAKEATQESDDIHNSSEPEEKNKDSYFKEVF
ncbi:hypothetical protein HG535_0C05470 [Zygotorulaspora mrakii]|uniref:Eisosome protein 1 n=1 Tax=Zygotorulaspora mrakii TaxID=42260 RepID=A0A7H9B0Z8_ZYGMR|nr:uncharacterized protein HG535_0C05470 [Zygotorulaspora mrakii]QLG72193.1 hypothetical protein HG535_0C05470 [Zygotorulaspora mrakii]